MRFLTSGVTYCFVLQPLLQTLPKHIDLILKITKHHWINPINFLITSPEAQLQSAARIEHDCINA